MSDLLHSPSPKDMTESRLGEFLALVEGETGLDFGAPGPACYQKLHRWSVENLERFHDLAWGFCGLIGEKGQTILQNPDDILAAIFFPEAKISFAENMLARAKTHPDEPAIISRTAGRDEDRILSWQALYDTVSLWEQALEKLGVGEGDRIATYLPHAPEAYIIMIACAQRGAIFSSVGTEMGAQSTAARFAQIRPKVLIAADGYTHMKAAGQPGKAEDRLDLIKTLQDDLPSLEQTVIIPNLNNTPDLSALNKNTTITPNLLQNVQPRAITFTRQNFNTPLAILFSSGSTGQPKCFVHGVGGTLLKHAMEYQFQTDVRPGDRVFFHSTTSWMMFNWLASGLAQDAAIMIYDGNPAYPSANAHLQFAADYGCTHLGTAAGLIQDVWAANNVSTDGLDLSALRSLIYTGSVLSEGGYRYVNSHVKADMSINGICGGTDFVGSYTMGNAFTSTIAGHLKGAVLGMDIDVWTENGAPAPDGETGELVVKNPFASRPLYFWNDEDGSRFKKEYFTYFERTPPVWRHGDAVKRLASGELIVEGRSDTTLNQGGVRIGTQQLYDALTHPDIKDRITDALAANFKDAQSSDHTALFIVLANNAELDDGLKKTIKSVISDSVGRLSTPHEIIAVPYILKTPNGKKAEKPTAAALAGKAVQAPETYGTDERSRQLKVKIFQDLGKNLRNTPAYSVVKNTA